MKDYQAIKRKLETGKSYTPSQIRDIINKNNWEKAQRIFDKGDDPTKMQQSERATIVKKREKSAGGIAAMIESIIADIKKTEKKGA